MQQRARVESVGLRLRKAAAASCAKQNMIKQELGVIVWSLANFPSAEDRQRLQSSFDLTDKVTVALAVEGGPAAPAGLTVGSIVTHVNGRPLQEGKGATERFVAYSNAGAREGPVRVQLASGDTLTLTPQTVCEFPTLLVRSPEINAAADGRLLAITTSLFELTRSDDELAVILGHELAHNLLGHLKKFSEAQKKPGGLLDAFVRATIGTAVASAKSTPYSIEFEREADYVGLHIAARAGYDITAAASLWRRLNETLRATSVIKTHPSGPERLQAIEATIAEIKAKTKAKKPLDLDLKPRQ
ncbi:MAG: M48 family metalloprotease [Alphaproteobacteria bacterium]|nr:M48 family metalloprotease [Alphaproteobacteria bacterium]